MRTVLRPARLLVSLVSVAATAAALLVGAAPAEARSGHPAGLVGRPITIARVNQLVTYDVGAAADGTAYVAWISAQSGQPRKVHLCRLPVSKRSCTGGVQTISAIDGSSAAGLRVVVTGDGVVHLLWFHDTAQSVNGPNHGAIAEATAPGGLNLGSGHDVITDAPSFGHLLDAKRGPGGAIWTVTYRGVPTKAVQVRPGLSATPLTVPTPFSVSYDAQLAFSGSTAVMTIEEYGSISTPVYWAKRPAGGSFGSFRAVARTWAVGTNAALAHTRHGVRLVTGVNNASYRPVIAKWTGNGFTRRALTADHNSCAPNTHDGWADASGRLLDASWECNRVTVTNYADAYHAAITRFAVSDTPTLAPQIASGTRGFATVAYSTQGVGQLLPLRVARIRLPDSTRAVRKVRTAGRVRVIGPRSCLPPVNVHIAWSHRARHGWHFTSGALRLAGKVVSPPTLDGARLAAGRVYYLVGTAHFAKNGKHRRVRAVLSFRTCGTG